MAQKEWFAEWFNSPWYHLLYKNRDEKAAQQEINAMVSALNLQPASRVLDLACGKGRHAIHLANLGFDVTGLDISDESIEYARTLEHESLSFYQHDMRLPFRSNYYDAVMNIFTSFGYFKRMHENEMALRNMHSNLKPGGVLLLDFLNAQYVQSTLVKQETKQVNDTTFKIKKEIKDGFVIKTIRFEAEGRKMMHREQVQLLTPAHFEKLCDTVGLKMEQRFGGYDLAPYHPDTSTRFIFTARKA
jgi:ubiquinone/menaquinone biosynthesis C-methylase UbiE